MKYLIFDTETTGLPKYDSNGVKTYPHVVQLSWVLFDGEKNKIISEKDRIWKLPEDIEIPEDTIAIHGIDRQKMLSEGKDPKIVIDEFIKDLGQCSMIVGHNIDFDKNMLFTEFKRNNKFDYRLGTRPSYCTMGMGKPVCKIKRVNKQTGEIYYKKPKLIELHDYLFNQLPKNLHNSLVDVWVTLRCFGKLYLKRDILENNSMIEKHYNHICSL
jgi:DNA polymerase III epsilon subunit-like protein